MVSVFLPFMCFPFYWDYKKNAYSVSEGSGVIRWSISS